MEIQLDKAKCQAYGNCADEAPQLLRLDDGGYAEIIGDGSVPEAEQAAGRSAVLSCPASALRLLD